MPKKEISKQTQYNGVPILIAVDCIIFGFDNEGLKLLLFKRKVEPFKGDWSLIGSFVKDIESVSAAAKRVLKESTGLKGIFLKELSTYSQPDRDPGGRVISVAHYALVRLNTEDANFQKDFNAKWFDVKEIPKLILDHNEMVGEALNRLREHAEYHPIGYELLPKKFTIPQMQILYEAIYQKELDRRNFSKKISAMKILEKLDEKDKSTSKKGAYLYKFNKEKYEKLLEGSSEFNN